MLVFASSDKGGTGRSVTGCNIAYQLAQKEGKNVAYLDFDFGSPTAGAIFGVTEAERGIKANGLHSYFCDGIATPRKLDLRHAARHSVRHLATMRRGELWFLPGNLGGAEFEISDLVVQRCAELLSKLDSQHDVCIIDLSAGRSTALNMVLAATASKYLEPATSRWLVFHRWTRQHIIAAHGLVNGDRGILDVGEHLEHDRRTLEENIRFVQVAVPPLGTKNSGDNATQAGWLEAITNELRTLAIDNGLGPGRVLGTTPIETILQYREQLITSTDVSNKVAKVETVEAFQDLAAKLIDKDVWEG